MQLVGRPKLATPLPKALPRTAVQALLETVARDEGSKRQTSWTERDLALISSSVASRGKAALQLRSQTPIRRQRYYQQYDVTATDDAGRRVDLSKAEDRAFWTWATVEVLRHTGIRIEELLELTHLSLRPLRKPDGQIIPLLQIAPSKNDAERILPVGPELAHVLSRIVLRHTGSSPDHASSDAADSPATVPLVSRWDEHERVHSAPLPYLFQRSFLIGRRSTISSGTVRNWLAAAANTAGLCDVDGRPLAFSPHDFRRVFLTDAVRTGLPIHIAAQLAGHDDLNTTRRYAATYPTEVIEHYQQFIARRPSTTSDR